MWSTELGPYPFINKDSYNLNSGHRSGLKSAWVRPVHMETRAINGNPESVLDLTTSRPETRVDQPTYI